MNRKKTYKQIREVHKVKQKEIKKFSRGLRVDPKIEKREMGLYFGSVWGVNDASVPFNGKRDEEHLKDSLRPSLVLKTPDSFEDFTLVEMAPGTSHEHPVGYKHPICLRADVPPEELAQTTYFLLYLKWSSVQKNLEKRFCELSTELKNILSKII